MTRIGQVEEVLHEIGAEAVPCLQVFNKIDLRDGEQARIERDEFGVPTRVYVSARERLGLDLLREAIAERLLPQFAEQDLTLPPSAARLRAQLFTHHAVRGETVDEQIGRASCRERVCEYVLISGVAVYITKKT